MGGDFSSKLTNYVNEAGDARTLADDTFVEYDLGSVSPDPVYDIDPLTGDSKYRSDASANVPNSTDNPRTASWISERNPGVRQWRNPYEALLELNTKLAAAQTGTDLITSRQRLRESPASFQLASRTQGVVTVGASLGTGVRNSAAVIPDTTGLE
jgi:hypothetical protein